MAEAPVPAPAAADGSRSEVGQAAGAGSLARSGGGGSPDAERRVTGGAPGSAGSDADTPRGPAGGGPVASALPGEGGSVPPEYGPYLTRFRRRVQESLLYPLVARRRGLTGSVEVEVLIEPSGAVKTARVVTSSSHAVLDTAALDAIRSLAPLPLPEHLPRRALRIRLPLSFMLE